MPSGLHFKKKEKKRLHKGIQNTKRALKAYNNGKDLGKHSSASFTQLTCVLA
jgi:hypothetical protein